MINLNTSVDVSFICCGTCKFWEGDTKYKFPSIVILDNGSKGKCTNTYFGADTLAMGSCSNWEQRYK